MLDSDYVPRLLEKGLSDFGKSCRAKILLGPRQVGKSTLLERLTRGTKRIVLSGEDESDLAVLSDVGSSLRLTQEFEAIVIDEAQYVPSIGRIIKRLVDTNKTGAKIYVTGSSSLDLAAGIKESAAGRFETKNLWALSLEELAGKTSWIESKRELPQYVIYGMLPATINEPEKARDYLLDFSDAVLYKDLFSLSEMRKPTELVRLVKYLAHSVGSDVRYGSIANELGIQNKTIERYVDLLEAAFIIKVVPSLSRNPKSELKLSKKIYFCDNGIRNALIRDFTPLAAREDAGALWENFFFTERLKFHANRRDGAEIYFWRNLAKHEVDFLEVLDGKVRAFECKLKNTKRTTAIRAFERAYPESPVTIATPENIDTILTSA